MERDPNLDLAMAINRLNRAMLNLAEIHSTIGHELGRSLETGLLAIEALDQLEAPPLGLDRVIRYVETHPLTAHHAPQYRRR